MKIKSYSSSVYTVLLFAVSIIFSFFGCEPNATGGCVPEAVSVESQFTIKNESSSERNIKLYEIHFYSDKWDNETPYLVSSTVLNSKSETTMQSSQAVQPGYGGILSLMLTIDEKRYAGWKLADESPDMKTVADEYGFGYLYVADTFPVPWQSKLSPKEEIDGFDTIKVFYTVTITDDSINFDMTKLINQNG
jgi:hypothetical protein